MLTRNLKKYLELRNKLEEEDDDHVQAELEGKIDELYFELSEDEVDTLEIMEKL